MKSPRFRRLRPVNRFRKSVTENRERFRSCFQNIVQSLVPGKLQIPRVEQNRHQIVTGMQFPQDRKALSRFKRPTELQAQKVEDQRFHLKTAYKDDSAALHAIFRSNPDAELLGVQHCFSLDPWGGANLRPIVNQPRRQTTNHRLLSTGRNQRTTPFAGLLLQDMHGH